MQVTATQEGFFGNHLKAPGVEFEIPDEPRRPVTKDDDAMTRSIADKKKTVPCAFSSVWMRPGWARRFDGPMGNEAKPPAAVDLDETVI
jgi:hypothetical protein